MPKRKQISKKVRFEVFKRDSFTCQYCGKAAPDVVLHVDHIDPHSRGGSDEIINLITSCLPCNLGKSNTPLGEQTTLAKQRAQLVDLNERREQLEMMMEWRQGVKDIRETEVERLAEYWKNALGGHWFLNDNGLRDASKLLRRFPLAALLDAVDIAVERYMEWDGESKPIAASVGAVWKKVGGIAAMNALPQIEKDLRYIRGIVRNRMYCNDVTAMETLRAAVEAGINIDDLKELAKQARNWTGWQNEMWDLIGRAPK